MLGELARGIEIDLDAVAKHTKYDGLSDVELILSESQERMSIVIERENYHRVMHFFHK